MTNLLSKQGINSVLSTAQAGLSGGNLPALDPSAVANYYAQLQTLQSQLTNQLAALKSQRVGLKGEASVAVADTRQQGQQAITEAISSSMDRGVLGSSADVEQRIKGQAAIKSGVTDIHRSLYDTLAQNRLQGAGAALSFEQGAQGIASQAIASRMSLQAQELQNALAIRIANQQAAASAASTAAEMSMANAQLELARTQAQNNQIMANNPQTSLQYVMASTGMTKKQAFKTYPWLKPPKTANTGGSSTNDNWYV